MQQLYSLHTSILFADVMSNIFHTRSDCIRLICDTERYHPNIWHITGWCSQAGNFFFPRATCKYKIWTHRCELCFVQWYALPRPTAHTLIKYGSSSTELSKAWCWLALDSCQLFIQQDCWVNINNWLRLPTIDMSLTSSLSSATRDSKLVSSIGVFPCNFLLKLYLCQSDLKCSRCSALVPSTSVSSAEWKFWFSHVSLAACQRKNEYDEKRYTFMDLKVLFTKTLYAAMTIGKWSLHLTHCTISWMIMVHLANEYKATLLF